MRLGAIAPLPYGDEGLPTPASSDGALLAMTKRVHVRVAHRLQG